MSTFVFVEQTPISGREVPAIAGMVVGRGQCDVVLLDPHVSRRHAVVAVTPAGPAIEDLGSTNGTWVNEQRIAGPHRLRAGDIVRFGKTVWQVRTAPAGDAGEATAAAIRRPPEPPDDRATGAGGGAPPGRSREA